MHTDMPPERDLELIGYAAREFFGADVWTARRLDGGFQTRVYLVDCPDTCAGRFVARAGDDIPGLYREFLIERDVVPAITPSAPRALGFFSGAMSGLSAREFMEGEPLLQAAEVDYGAVMDLLAGLHSVDPRMVPPAWADIYWDYSEGRQLAAFEEFVSVLAALKGDLLCPDWYSPDLVACAERLKTKADKIISLIESADKSLVHGDAVPVNLLKVAETGSYQLIDWQQFGLYVPHLDFLSALYHHQPAERQPLVGRYLSTYQQLTGRQIEPDRFAVVMDYVDLQKSAAVASFWLGNVLAGRTAYDRVAGFVGRRVRALERIAAQYEL